MCFPGKVFKNIYFEKHLQTTAYVNSGSSATLLKKRLWDRCYAVNFTKFLRTHFFIKHIWWLLLWFIVVASIILTWTRRVLAYAGSNWKLKTFYILQKNTCFVFSKKFLEFLFCLVLFLADICLFKARSCSKFD